MYRFREMVEMDGGPSSRPPPQISDMLQKFALAFKNKTYKLFAEDDESDGDVTLLLDSAEEFIPDQKVVVIKPDPVPVPGNSTADLLGALIPSLFATISSFEASYLQFQAAHVPKIDQSSLEETDKSIVSILQKLTKLKNMYRDSQKGSGTSCDFHLPTASFLEFQVQENQSKLRVLETMMNYLQSQMDVKDEEASALRKNLDMIRVSNTELSHKLGMERENSGFEVLRTIRVFEAMLSDSVHSVRHFVKLLIDLMQRAGWDLEKAANSVYSDVCYAKRGHFRYAFLSYICLGMFHNFNKNDFDLAEVICNANGSVHNGNGDNGDGVTEQNDYLRQLIEHVASNPMEVLSKNKKCQFSRFCEKKYEKLIHPTMESSIFRHLDRKEKVLDSWKSLSVFRESFVRMASSVWLLHKLAYSFNPAVEIFQVERGTEFSMMYMEDVLRKTRIFSVKNKLGVGFTVVPGFKVGKTVIQSQVYLSHTRKHDDE